MKKKTKFFSCLFIILVVLGVAFYFGYSPMKVPHDSVGVLISKTSGVSDTPIENGKFRYDWQLLIPTNAKIRVFSIKPYNVSKVKTGLLPSGDVYSKLLKESPDFSYSFSLDYELKFNSLECVKLVKESNIATDSDLQKKYEIISNQISEKIVNYIFEEFNSTKINQLQDNASKIFSAINNAKEKIINEYSLIVQIQNLNIQTNKMPDLQLYNLTKNMYIDYISEVNKKLVTMTDKQALEISEYTKNLNKLEKFGKVLKENPILSDFLKSSKDMNETLKTIYSFN